jgi:hypothetical protein
MTMKSTLIMPMALVAALAAGVLVHDRLRTKSFAQDAAPTRTASIATATPAAPAPVSPPPVSTPPPATPEPEPPRHMTASQEASLDAWMIKTYLACWKPAAQPADADPYVARVRLRFKPDGSLLKPPKLVNPPSDPAQKPQAKSVLKAVKACDPLPMPVSFATADRDPFQVLVALTVLPRVMASSVEDHALGVQTVASSGLMAVLVPNALNSLRGRSSRRRRPGAPADAPLAAMGWEAPCPGA